MVICHTGYVDCLRAGSGWNCSSILILLASNQHTLYDIRGLLEKYPTFGREKETGLLGALDT
jgi:hypothetical protein